MKDEKRRGIVTRLGLLVVALAATGLAIAAERPAPSVPEPPDPPAPPEVSVKGFRIRSGETHKGNVVRFDTTIDIEGTLDGDLYAVAQSVRISGVVTGDVFTTAQQVDVTGEIKQGFRAAGANVVIDGLVDGNVLITGGSLTLGSKAHVAGNVTAYTGQLTQHGMIDGSLEFAGGTAVLGGKIVDDATLTADALAVEPGASVGGDITYSTRKPMDEELKAIAGGDVTYDAKPIEKKREKEKEERHLKPSKLGIGKWIAFFTASFLFGCALLAIFSEHAPKVTQIIQTDPLRASGIGFVSILVSIAVCLSAILLITIPFVVIYCIAYVVAIYLAKIPVAVWLGRAILEKLNRPGSAYLDLFVGLVALYLVFMIPVLGWLAWFVVTLLGMGAMTMAYLAHRQARKVATLAA